MSGSIALATCAQLPAGDELTEPSLFEYDEDAASRLAAAGSRRL